MGMDFYTTSLVLLTISTTGGAINFIVTILHLRAPGMAISRMPLFLYSTLTVSGTILFALPALTACCIFLELDRRWGTHFFKIAGGGDIFLWQQLFWFFGHPWVYVIFLPATGMLSLIIPVFARKAHHRLSVCRRRYRADRRRRLRRMAAPHVHGRHVRYCDELLLGR